MKLQITAKQKAFLQAQAEEVLFGGAAGGGKSYGQLVDALLFALKYQGSKQLILRRTYPELEKSKEKASFLVHVQFRQHATWQGTITWVNKGVTQQFRSVLEMIRLMTEAVESDNPERSGFPLPMEAEKPEDSPAGEKD